MEAVWRELVEVRVRWPLTYPLYPWSSHHSNTHCSTPTSSSRPCQSVLAVIRSNFGTTSSSSTNPTVERRCDLAWLSSLSAFKCLFSLTESSASQTCLSSGGRSSCFSSLFRRLDRRGRYTVKLRISGRGAIYSSKTRTEMGIRIGQTLMTDQHGLSFLFDISSIVGHEDQSQTIVPCSASPLISFVTADKANAYPRFPRRHTLCSSSERST
jgi:hypothetical protein